MSLFGNNYPYAASIRPPSHSQDIYAGPPPRSLPRRRDSFWGDRCVSWTSGPSWSARIWSRHDTINNCTRSRRHYEPINPSGFIQSIGGICGALLTALVVATIAIPLLLFAAL